MINQTLKFSTCLVWVFYTQRYMVVIIIDVLILNNIIKNPDNSKPSSHYFSGTGGRLKC